MEHFSLQAAVVPSTMYMKALSWRHASPGRRRRRGRWVRRAPPSSTEWRLCSYCDAPRKSTPSTCRPKVRATKRCSQVTTVHNRTCLGRHLTFNTKQEGVSVECPPPTCPQYGLHVEHLWRFGGVRLRSREWDSLYGEVRGPCIMDVGIALYVAPHCEQNDWQTDTTKKWPSALHWPA